MHFTTVGEETPMAPATHATDGTSRRRRSILMCQVAMAGTLFVLVAGCAKQPATVNTALSSGTAADRRPDAMSPSFSRVSPPSAQDTRVMPAVPAPHHGRPDPRRFAAMSDLPDVYFDFDRYHLRPSAQRTLLAHATWLRTHAKALVIIEGHCDERGTNEYNVALGERRAKAAMNYLVSHGVDASRVTVTSYGEDRPQCRERDEGCWARNRRAHFLVQSD
jgi:peptidoglycan-associated lipoprotein